MVTTLRPLLVMKQVESQFGIVWTSNPQTNKTDMKTILTQQDFETLNQIDPYTLIDYLSTKIIIFGSMKPEEIEDRELGITQYQIEKYLSNINTSALDSSELKYQHDQFLKELFSYEDLEEQEN